MLASQCSRHRLNKGLSHTFSRVSGWCLHGCGNRDDGRITTREGRPIEPGPTYTAQELDLFRQQTLTEHARKVTQ